MGPNTVSRREFLGGSLALGAALVSTEITNAQEPRIKHFSKMTRDELLVLLQDDSWYLRDKAEKYLLLLEQQTREDLHRSSGNIVHYREIEASDAKLDYKRSVEHIRLKTEEDERSELPWVDSFCLLSEGEKLPTGSARAFLSALSANTSNPMELTYVDKKLLDLPVQLGFNPHKKPFWEIIDQVELQNGSRLSPIRSHGGILRMGKQYNSNRWQEKTAYDGSIRGEMTYYSQGQYDNSGKATIDLLSEPKAQIYSCAVASVRSITSTGRYNVAQVSETHSTNSLSFAIEPSQDPHETVSITLVLDIEIIPFEYAKLQAVPSKQQYTINDWTISAKQSSFNNGSQYLLDVRATPPQRLIHSVANTTLTDYATVMPVDANRQALQMGTSYIPAKGSNDPAYVHHAAYSNNPTEVILNFPAPYTLKKRIELKFGEVKMKRGE